MVDIDLKNNNLKEISSKNNNEINLTMSNIESIKNQHYGFELTENNLFQSAKMCSIEQTQNNELEEPPNKKLRLVETINSSSEDLSLIKKIHDGKAVKKPEVVSVPKNHQSPKKKLQFKTNKNEKKAFIYGNYSRYYGYRCTNNFTDVRLDIFKKHLELFENKEMLDIGCNSGLLTCNIAEQFNLKNITGIDIDRKLIDFARTFIKNIQKKHTDKDQTKYPFNISFVHGNYVLRDDVLLEIEKEQFDCILCLSVTKWIQLNFGDKGLKQAFKRMFLQLRPGGKLILEAQPWESYRKRKKLTPEIKKNYTEIKLLPVNFTQFLLGPEIGFIREENLTIPEHDSKGFRRPIQVFYKNHETL